MKKVYILGLFIVLAIILIVYRQKSAGSLKTKVVNINGHKLTVEVADTDALRSKGLSGRVSLQLNTGMLFVFPASSYYHFWMKEMKFPLDFIFIDKEKIVGLTENVQPPKSSTEILKIFTARKPFDKVIEINAGRIKSLNISEDNVIKFTPDD